MDRLWPSGFVVSKLSPPPRHEHTVARERLIRELSPRPGVKLTLVAAPAGSGKSTLLGLWYADRTPDRPAAWVSLDERDDDPVVLWLHVLEAIRQARPEVDVTPAPDVAGPSGIIDVILPRLVNQLDEQESLALVLDDFHRLSPGQARDSLAWLVDHAPQTLQIVFSSRTEPALPVARLRAHGELLELRAEDLAFTNEEADVLLNRHLELGLEPGDVADLLGRTEGWPTGVYLAALSLRGVTDRHTFVQRFGAENRYVVNFLVTEVLEAHESTLQDLMLRCSVLDQMCGRLCDAVLERHDSADLLKTLGRSNLFLIALDDRGEWYRFHPLFAALLRVELEHRYPGAALALHRRAFDWCRDNELIDEAVDHALQAEAFAEAGELICSTWVALTNRGQHATVLGWLRQLPRPFVDADSRLLLVEAYSHSMMGNHDGAAQAIAKVEARGRLTEGPLPDGFSSVEASLATLRALWPWDDVRAGLKNAIRAAQLEGATSPWRSNICFALGFGHYYSGRIDEADRWFEESLNLVPQSEQWIIWTSALAYRSLISGLQGRLPEQRALAEEATAVAREMSVDEIDGEVFIAMAESLRAQGDLDDALRQFERAEVVLRSWGQPLDIAYAMIRKASLLRSMNKREAATAVVVDVATIVANCSDPGILRKQLAGLEGPISRLHSPRTARGDRELSERERAVLRLLAGTLSEREIARELYLSFNTVHTHTKSIYQKLHVSSRTDAVKRARARGLLRGGVISPR